MTGITRKDYLGNCVRKHPPITTTHLPPTQTQISAHSHPTPFPLTPLPLLLNELTHSKQLTNQLTASKCLLLPPHINHRGHQKNQRRRRGRGLETVRTAQIAHANGIIDVSKTNLKCLSDFCHLFIVITKVATNKMINQHERIRNKVFLQHIYYFTDDVILERSV